MNQNLFEVVRRFREINDLSSVQAVLEWDQQTYMPPKGNEARSRQSGLIAILAHERLVDAKLGELIEKCQADSTLSDEEKALIREAKRERDKAVKVPSELVREIADAAGNAYPVWVEARQKNDFSLYAPNLKKMVELKTREAQALGYHECGVPYDALLDNFEPGATVKNLDPIVSIARDLSIQITQAIAGSKRKPNVELLKQDFSDAEQEKFSRLLMDKMNYDLEAGRLDPSLHPFTTSFDIDDVRITTRYERNWLPGALFGTIHETGHALYDQGRSRKYWGTPLSQYLSLGIHESQSRLWENQIGRSKPFWRYFYPKLQQLFPRQLKQVSIDDFYFATNAVKPSLIRMEADEVTYNLHIVIRYELEQALFSGDLRVADLPEAWNEKMWKYLGVKPASDAEGVLQDIHWPMGSFGYFPTYLLGNLYAAQWMATMRKQIGDLDQCVAEGDLLPIKKWLNEKIHSHGRRYSPSELVRLVTGENLNPEHFGRYLKEKFGKLYEVSFQ